MTTDLVVELRAALRSGKGNYGHRLLCGKAADELDRLRTAAYQACSDMGCFCDGEDLPDDAKCAMCKLEKVLHG